MHAIQTYILALESALANGYDADEASTYALAHVKQTNDADEQEENPCL